jgi:hypothetical protein
MNISDSKSQMIFEIGILSADFSFMERRTSILSKENSPCRTYSQEIDNINNNNTIINNNNNNNDDDDSPGASFSSTFYTSLFHTKVLFQAFSYYILAL